MAYDCQLLFQRLKKQPSPWTNLHTLAVQRIKAKAKELPCLVIANPNLFKIIETDASDIEYGGILKQRLNSQITQNEQLICFTSGLWNPAQKNYSTIKKEILSIVLCVTKFENCKSAKDVLLKDIKNLASKQILARWDKKPNRRSPRKPDLHKRESSKKSFAQAAQEGANALEPYKPEEFKNDQSALSEEAYKITCILIKIFFESKNLNYYQAIINKTHSVVIEATDRKNKDIIFSKFLIKKVLTLQEWGIGFSAPRYLTQYQHQPKSFIYLDYTFAWEEGLLYENSLKRHSCWFKSWFFRWGANPIVFPKNVAKFWDTFKKFTIYYDIPWILKWNYRIFSKIEKKFSIQMTEPYLFRQNYLKWWNKFDFFDKDAVYTKRGVIALTPPIAPAKQPTPTTPQLSLKDMLAGLSQEEAMKLFAETFGVKLAKTREKDPCHHTKIPKILMRKKATIALWS
ncbi:hypothetical protein CDL12_15245 [Handroanthus impetiginosus]|uniref:Reverse transcriptase/retrotransposon-derived protein RNase H-like domain-containing protein n=1 Tax=Handroanthus impetiginosus TaxID=429701 RepID=A0A2G9H3Q0_9LAMI|nr:hypothetical protein CDL12_15245 [Handroanthus impetiginosus]